jgi:N-acetylglucosaminyl-diphospho-decaprenol L-rhamnosyltransferase
VRTDPVVTGPERRVSVVVITHNRREELARTLRSLLALPEAPAVIVVDNASSDGTPAMVRAEFPVAMLVALPGNWGAVGRNVGVGLATTPYVAFCDDDTWWDPGALTALSAILDANPRLAVVTARIVVEPEGVDDAIGAEIEGSSLPRPAGVPGHPLLSFLAGASIVRVAAFRAVGGFHPRIHLGGEEELLAAELSAAGWLLTYVPDVALHHHASVRRDSHLRRRRGIRNTLWFAWLRRPLATAAARTVAMGAAVPKDRVSLGGFVDAVRGLPWVLAERSPVGGAFEAGLVVLDRDQLRSEARRYVS